MRTFIIYCATVLLVIGVIVFMSLKTVDVLVTQATERAAAERDAHWTAEIAKSNLEAEIKRGAQAAAAIVAGTTARVTIEASSLKISELEKANEALSANACGGLGRSRVELLSPWAK